MTSEERAIQDIKAMSEHKNGVRLQFIEAIDETTPVFEQGRHKDVLLAVDKLALSWTAELARIREQTVVLEQMVIGQAAKVKDELTRMYMLGARTKNEAERTAAINVSIRDEIESMITESEDAESN